MDKIAAQDVHNSFFSPTKTLWRRIGFKEQIGSSQWEDIYKCEFQHRDSGRYYEIVWKEKFVFITSGYEREHISTEIHSMAEIFSQGEQNGHQH